MKTMRRILLLLFVVTIVAHAQLSPEMITARVGVSPATNKAKTDMGTDVALRGVFFAAINQGGIELKFDHLTGKATGWAYFFHSKTIDTLNTLILAMKIFGSIQLFTIPMNQLPPIIGNQQMFDLNDPWIDSDSARLGAWNGGGSIFFAQHSDAKVIFAAALYTPVSIPTPPIPAGPYWMFRFEATNAAQVCFVNGTTGVSIACAAVPTAVEEIPSGKKFVLEQNYPNPFSTRTTIQLEIKPRPTEGGLISLRVFDLLGREVTTLVNGEVETGTHEIVFDASQLPVGLYYYTLTSQNFSKSKLMQVLR